MGDESYFSNILRVYRKLLFKIDSGVTGLEEVEMLVGQFKELNRNLQEVMHTAKITIAGLKKDFGTDNLLSYLDIYGDNEISMDASEKKLWLETAMNLRS
jgi:hypothetical protein